MSITLRTTKGSELTYDELDMNIRIGAGYPTVSAMIADDMVFAQGDIVFAGGACFEVAASGASDHHLANAGSASKFYVRSDVGAGNPMAAGAVGNGTTDDTAAVVATDSRFGGIVLMPGKTFRITSNVTLSGPILWRGGKLKLDNGVTVSAAVIAPPSVQVFDISALAAVQGAQIADNEYVWGLNGGLVTKNLVVHAGWFGASSGAADNSPFIQAAMDSGADVVGIDGDYTFTANFFGNGIVTSTKPDGGRAKLTMKTQTLSLAIFAAGGYATHWFGGAKTFGLKNKGGIKYAKISRLELDGACEAHADWAAEYANFKTGTTFDKKYLCSANGIAAAEDENAATNSWVRAPEMIVIEDVYAHHWARNCILLNRTPKSVLRNNKAMYSAIDHCIYADTNRDSIFDNTEVGGYCEGGMIVTAGGSLTNILCQDITEHPLTDLYTTAVVQDRTDVTLATQIHNLRVIGDMEAFHPTDGTQRMILRSMGKKFMTWIGGWVQHTGSLTTEFSLWGIGGNTGIQYAGPIISHVELRDMPSGFRFINAPDTEVKFAQISECQVRYAGSVAAFTGALFEFSTCGDITIRGVKFDAIQGIGCTQLLRCSTGAANDVMVDGLRWPCGSTSSQWATATSFVRCCVANSRLRCAQPNTVDVLWHNSWFGGGPYVSNNRRAVAITTDGTSTTYNVSHSFGSGVAIAVAHPMDAISVAAGYKGCTLNSGSITLHFTTAPAAGTMTMTVELSVTG